MITHKFSFAVLLRRVFDSKPPEGQVFFYSCGKLAHPIAKSNGMYVFIDDTVLSETLEIHCKGYFRKTISPMQNKIIPAVLYPDKFCCLPYSFKMISGEGIPNKAFCFADHSCNVRLFKTTDNPCEMHLGSRPCFTGGSLLFDNGKEKQSALILEKNPDGLYVISKKIYNPISVHRIYHGLCSSDGDYYAAVPQDFFAKEGDLTWDSEL